MKRFAILVAVVSSLALPSCAALQDAIKYGTASIENPVTPTMLHNMQNGAIVITAGLNGYKKSCAAGVIPPSCYTVVSEIQVYTRKLPPILVSLRTFVRTNDTVNAALAYNTVKQLITDARSVATTNNVAIGGL